MYDCRCVNTTNNSIVWTQEASLLDSGQIQGGTTQSSILTDTRVDHSIQWPYWNKDGPPNPVSLLKQGWITQSSVITKTRVNHSAQCPYWNKGEPLRSVSLLIQGEPIRSVSLLIQGEPIRLVSLLIQGWTNLFSGLTDRRVDNSIQHPYLRPRHVLEPKSQIGQTANDRH